MYARHMFGIHQYGNLLYTCATDRYCVQVRGMHFAEKLTAGQTARVANKRAEKTGDVEQGGERRRHNDRETPRHDTAD